MDDPNLARKLSRLEAKFRSRYYASIQKDLARRKKGKPSHKTTLQSIENNQKRWEEVRHIRTVLFQNSLENQGQID